MATVFFSAALKKERQNQSDHHKQAVYDCLAFRRSFTFSTKRSKSAFKRLNSSLTEVLSKFAMLMYMDYYR